VPSLHSNISQIKTDSFLGLADSVSFVDIVDGELLSVVTASNTSNTVDTQSKISATGFTDILPPFGPNRQLRRAGERRDTCDYG